MACTVIRAAPTHLPFPNPNLLSTWPGKWLTAILHHNIKEGELTCLSTRQLREACVGVVGSRRRRNTTNRPAYASALLTPQRPPRSVYCTAKRANLVARPPHALSRQEDNIFFFSCCCNTHRLATPLLVRIPSCRTAIDSWPLLRAERKG